jgi:hypothetical protein
MEAGPFGREPLVNRVLYIEGTKDDTNGDLREGFRILLEQKLKGKMPRLVMGNGKEETMNFFNNERLNVKYTHRNVVVDSDATELEKSREEREKRAPDLFFMVQEMEAWFLSQPEILDERFGVAVSKKIPSGDVTNIPDPSDKLYQWTKDCKMPYHKVHHGVLCLKN